MEDAEDKDILYMLRMVLGRVRMEKVDRALEQHMASGVCGCSEEGGRRWGGSGEGWRRDICQLDEGLGTC